MSATSSKKTVGKLFEGKTDKQVAKIALCDPACGSGSFLIGAYQYLLSWYLDFYKKDPSRYEGKIVDAISSDSQAKQYRLTTTEKKQILLRHIYGVDLDTQAVEVAKLSLLLKVLEGETSETIDSELKFNKKRALPDLAKNIMCGNALVGTDFYTMDLSSKKKGGQFEQQLFGDEERFKINAFDWEVGFPEIFKRGGFDAIIGNPPYIRIQTMQEYSLKSEIAYLKKSYFSAKERNIDIYFSFLEKAYQLLNKDGLSGYILPHRFFNTEAGKNIRQYLAEHKAVKKVIHFHDNQIFEGVTAYTCLFFMSKEAQQKIAFHKFPPKSDIPQSLENAKTQSINANSLKESIWTFPSPKEKAVLDKINRQPLKVDDITKEIFVGLQTSADKVYVLEQTENTDPSADVLKLHSQSLDREVQIERGIVKPFLMGKDIKRYQTPTPNKWVIFPYEISGDKAILLDKDFISTQFPLAWEYLSENKKALKARERGKKFLVEWWQFSRPQNLTKFEQEKILIPDISYKPSFTYDGNHIYHTTTIYSLILSEKVQLDLMFVLGLLNSNLLFFFIRK